MSGLIYDFFELVLTSLLDLISDYIYKSSRLSNITSEEDLEFILGNKLGYDIFNLLLMLLSIV